MELRPATAEIANPAVPNTLAARYASERMCELWSPRSRVILERRLWLAVLRAQQSLGLAVDNSVIDDYEAVIGEVDLESIAKRESVTRHDVKARIDEFCALAGHERIHLAMTSRDLTENTEQLIIRNSLKVILDDLVAFMARLADLAERYARVTMVGRTHNVAAQATTLGKRFADVLSEALIAYARLSDLIRRYPLRGIKGAVGTRLDQLDLLGSDANVNELERMVAKHLGFDEILITSAQTYPRSLDLDVVAALVQAVSAPASLATTLRLMAGHAQVSEGFREGQVGSSVMPHKVNARSSERIAALRTVLSGHLTMAANLAGQQWNEGDVSCSAARRTMLPDAFFAANGILQTATAVLDELQINTAAIAAELKQHLPVLVTTRMLTVLVESGMGREEAHKVLAEPSRQTLLATQPDLAMQPDIDAQSKSAAQSVIAAQATPAAKSTSDTPATDTAATEPVANLGSLLGRLAADPRTSHLNAQLQRLIDDPVELTGSAVNQTLQMVEAARTVFTANSAAVNQRPEVRF